MYIVMKRALVASELSLVRILGVLTVSGYVDRFSSSKIMGYENLSTIC